MHYRPLIASKSNVKCSILPFSWRLKETWMQGVMPEMTELIAYNIDIMKSQFCWFHQLCIHITMVLHLKWISQAFNHKWLQEPIVATP